MFVYILFFIILAILALVEYFKGISYKRKKAIIILILIAYVIYSVSYNGPAGDYDVYEGYFVGMDTGHFPKMSQEYLEYLYVLVSYFVRLFTANYKCLRLVLAIIVMSLCYKIYTDPAVTMGNRYNFFVMLAVWAMDSGLTHIARSTIAIAICLFSFRYIRRREFIKFLICVAFAVGFHMMSVIWILMYFAYNAKRLRGVLFILMLAILVNAQFIPDIILAFGKIVSRIPVIGEHIGEKLYNYTERGQSTMYGIQYSYDFTALKAVSNMVLVIAIAQWVSNYMKRKKKQCDYILEGSGSGAVTTQAVFNAIYNQYLIGACIYVIALIVSIGLSRAALFYVMAQYCIFPYVLEIFKRKSSSPKAIVFCLFVIYFFVRMAINNF